jgi:hypothetical protein
VAKFLAQDFKVTLAGVNLSNNIKSVELQISVDDKETTAFGDGYTTRIAGLKSGSLKLDFMQDFGASSVEATIYPLIGTLATVVITPTSSSVSATNPSYTAVCLVNSHSPVAGAVGDVATFSVTWPTSGTVVKAIA